MMTRYLSATIRCLLLFTWLAAAPCVYALAAVATADQMDVNIPASLLVATFLLSTLAGATTFAIRVVAELKTIADSENPSKPLVTPWLFCLSHMCGSWLAGTLFFLFAMQQQAGVWMLLSMVLLASFGGAKVIESAAERWLPTNYPKGGAS